MTGGGSEGEQDAPVEELAASAGDVFAGGRLGGHYQVEGPLGDGGMGAAPPARVVEKAYFAEGKIHSCSFSER